MSDLENAGGYFSAEAAENIIGYLREIKQSEDDKNVSCDFPFRLEDGSVIWIRAVCALIRDTVGRPVRGIGHFLDVTEEKTRSAGYVSDAAGEKARGVGYVLDAAEEKTRGTESGRDSLTGFYRKQPALTKIEQYFLQMEPGENAALILFDLDNFHMVNNTFGHLAGDRMMTDAARKIRASFRSDDIICRSGADEFLVLCRNIHNLDITDKLEATLKSLRTALLRSGQPAEVSASVGYVVIPEQGCSLEELYRKAEAALAVAKAQGRGSVRRYEGEMRR